MCKNSNKNLGEELTENQLEQVTGGDSHNVADLTDGVPGHWAVTCTRCGLQFFVRINRDCPSCANTEVYLTYDQNASIYDSDRHGGRG